MLIFGLRLDKSEQIVVKLKTIKFEHLVKLNPHILSDMFKTKLLITQKRLIYDIKHAYDYNEP